MSTISSMRPELWKTYEKMVKQYKEEGRGIYDDTADSNKAIALNDDKLVSFSKTILISISTIYSIDNRSFQTIYCINFIKEF